MSSEMGTSKAAETGRAKMVHIAADAVMFAPSGDLEWMVRYGDIVSVRYVAASIIASYAYLVSANISTKEAVRRLRILRSAPPVAERNSHD